MVEIVRSGDVEFDVQSPVTLKDGSVLYSVGENQIAKYVWNCQQRIVECNE